MNKYQFASIHVVKRLGYILICNQSSHLEVKFLMHRIWGISTLFRGLKASSPLQKNHYATSYSSLKHRRRSLLVFCVRELVEITSSIPNGIECVVLIWYFHHITGSLSLF